MTVQTVLKPKADVVPLKTGIDQEDRKAVANGLAQILADTWVLLIKTQGYHWNVVGPMFYSVHKLTEDQYKDQFAAIDVIGERIRALGFPAPQSFADVIALSALYEESKVMSAQGMLEQLVADHETIARRARDVAKAAAKLDDPVTEDLMIRRLEAHEEAVWMLRSITQ
jgi:starvation-inducible DNA-binding protein